MHSFIDHENGNCSMFSCSSCHEVRLKIFLEDLELVFKGSKPLHTIIINIL